MRVCPVVCDGIRRVTLNVQHTEVTRRSITNGSLKALVIDLVAKRKLTDVSVVPLKTSVSASTPGSRRSYQTIRVSIPSKIRWYTIPAMAPLTGRGRSVAQRRYVLCLLRHKAGVSRLLYPRERSGKKVILPAGYRANGIFDSAETYSTVYKGDWISYSPINQKYRVSQLLEPNSEGMEYRTDIHTGACGGGLPCYLAGYDKPTSLPYNMKVLSMQWLGPDNEPMRKFDKFELGKSYFLDLSIGFEGGEELGHVYPKNNRDFR